MSTPGVFPSFTRASGATPSRPGASTNRRKPIATCCAPRGSRSRRARARCRPRSARAGANPVRCSAPMPNTMRCRGTRSRSSPIRRRAPGFTLGPPGTPTRTRHDGTRRDAGSEGGNGEVRPRRHLALLRRARRKGLRLNAGARCQGLLRRRRPSSLITRTSPTQRSATRSAALIGALFSRSRQSRRRGGSTRASFRRPTPRMRRPAAWVRSTRSA